MICVKLCNELPLIDRFCYTKGGIVYAVRDRYEQVWVNTACTELMHKKYSKNVDDLARTRIGLLLNTCGNPRDEISKLIRNGDLSKYKHV